MKINIEHYLTNIYRPWGGAKEVWKRMTNGELEKIEQFMNEESFTEWDEMAINDFFWFNDETWLDIIGETEENFFKRENERELK